MLAAAPHIRSLALLRRVRSLPARGDLLARRGLEVTPLQVIGRCPTIKPVHILPAARELGVPAEALEGYLRAAPGSEVDRGAVLAQRDERLGRSRVVRSPADGLLLEPRFGYLVVQEYRPPFELRANMHGRVAGLLAERALVIEAIGAQVRGAWASGKDGHGRIRVIAASGDEPLSPRRDFPAARGAILVAGLVNSLEGLHLLEESGIRGLIAGSMPAELCPAAERLVYPIILTDGLGQLPMSPAILDLLRQLEGRDASLFAAQSGPWAQPAEVLAPLPLDRAPETARQAWEALKAGAKVRVYRLSDGPREGVVVTIRRRPQASRLGQRPAGAVVQLTGGQTLFVPVNNLEPMV